MTRGLSIERLRNEGEVFMEELSREYLKSLELALDAGRELGLRLYPLATYPLGAEPELRDELLQAALSAKEANFLLHSLNEARTLGSNDLLRAFVRRFDLDARPWDPDSDPAGSWERPLVKLVVTAEDPEAVGRFEAETADLPLERTYSLPNMLELGPAGVHKGSGLATLLDHTGHAPREVVVAGDGENDLALFEMATLRFAPADSPPAIRARADRVLDVRKEGLLAPILREVRARTGT